MGVDLHSHNYIIPYILQKDKIMAECQTSKNFESDGCGLFRDTIPYSGETEEKHGKPHSEIR
jgi:hypothetical protein